MSAQKKRVVVVGGGPGGLCAAMLLSARGFEVTLLERRGELGGRTSALKLGPYTFDVGSTMVMMPFVLEEMFALAGRELANELELMPIEPMYRLDFDGSALEMSADPTRMKAELERFSPGASRGLERFMHREQKRLEHLYPVLQRSWPSLASMVSPAVASALPHVGLGHSLYKTASDYFEDPRLRLAFSFQSAYLGMSPWDCPGGFAMVPFVEHAWGIDHLKGGVNQLCAALARVAVSNGARLCTHAPVRRLLTEGERCIGVELESGERLACDELVLNADAAHALTHMVEHGPSVRFNQHHLEHLAESCSTFMLYLGLDQKLPLAHNTFFFANDYQVEMRRVFDEGRLADDLSVYVCNPSRTDSTLAPPGHSALYLLALVPNTRAPINWSEEGPRMRERMLEVVEKRGGVRVRDAIRIEATLTPRDWETQFGISHGAVFGPAHRIGQLLAFRLPNQLPWPENVVLAGGATSPGSGLPTILESARISARILCQRHGVQFPPSKPLPQPLLAS